MYEESLQHHGILGQKWGVRRFQNKDGSLTPKGKKRVSEAYKKESEAMSAELRSHRERSMVNAYNRAAIEENKKISDAMAKGEDKKMSTDAWNQKWSDSLKRTYDKYYAEEIINIVNNSKHQKMMKQLVKDYGMLEWDALAKENAREIDLIKSQRYEELDEIARR